MLYQLGITGLNLRVRMLPDGVPRRQRVANWGVCRELSKGLMTRADAAYESIGDGHNLRDDINL